MNSLKDIYSEVILFLIGYVELKVQGFFSVYNFPFLMGQGVWLDSEKLGWDDEVRAYVFVADLIRSARQSIVLIDNYIDDSVLIMLSKRTTGVSAEIRTCRLPQTLLLDVQKHNAQYAPIVLTQVKNIHDRFLIIDDTVFHIGASLKDLGRKLFAFSKMSIPVQCLF